MNNQQNNLKIEADYQDLKITNNPREHLNKLYNDDSSRYRYQYRNDFLGEIKQKKVLDLGCGNGFASIDALRSGAIVTAIDISPKSINALILKAKDEHLENNLRAIVMDAQNLDFPDNSFDIVFGNGILHHLPNLDQSISEIYRVLKHSGYAVFLEPLGMNPLLKIFRHITPSMRTPGEQPLRLHELKIIKEYFPNTQYVFFDFSTLLSKIPLLIGLKKFGNSLQKRLISLDDYLIRRNNTDKITFLQKMSWMVVMKMIKNF